MRRHAMFCTALAAFALVLSNAVALAALKSGDQIVYTLKMSPGHGPSLDSKITAVVDRIDRDGTAHANVSIDAPHMPSAKAEATISRAGEIIPKTDPNVSFSGSMPTSTAAAKAIYEKESAAAAPGMLMMNVGAINAVAGAVGQRKSLKVGDSWQAAGPTGVMEQINYKVTGREQHMGRDAYVVALQSLPGASSTVTGTAYYDPAARLVVAVHCETNTSAGMQIVDAALAQ